METLRQSHRAPPDEKPPPEVPDQPAPHQASQASRRSRASRREIPSISGSAVAPSAPSDDRLSHRPSPTCARCGRLKRWNSSESWRATTSRDWFKANRERYDLYLVEPARDLADQLGDLGKPHLFRPYNDTRFHLRPPIKEQLGLAIGYGGAGGFYIELSLDGLLVAAGMHARPPISSSASAPRLTTGVVRPRSNARSGPPRPLGWRPPRRGLKRAPRGYPLEHPRIDRLRMRELTVYRRHQLGPWLHKRSADARVRKQLDSARPLVSWLGKHVGPSQAR